MAHPHAYIWPDKSWCWHNELSCMGHRSDDYYAVTIPEWFDDQDVDYIAHQCDNSLDADILIQRMIDG